MKPVTTLLATFFFTFQFLQAQSIFCTSDNSFTNIGMYQGNIGSVLNVPYGPDSTNHLMDIYFPLPVPGLPYSSKRPTVMLIHGGGFTQGDKNNFRSTCIQMAESGYTAVTIKYRLGHDCSPSDYSRAVYNALQDAHLALIHLYQNNTLYGVHKNYMFIGGSSAGAITALNVVYFDQEEADALYPGLVDSEGPIRPVDAPPINLQGVFSSAGAVLPALYDSEQSIPLIAFHGANDTIVPIDENIGTNCSQETTWGSQILFQLLKSEGTCVELNVHPTDGHGVYSGQQTVRNGRVMCFFKSILCATCNDATKYIKKKVTPPACGTPPGEASIQDEKDAEVFIAESELVSYRVLDLRGVVVAQNITQSYNLIHANYQNLNLQLTPGIYFVQWPGKTGMLNTNKICIQ